MLRGERPQTFDDVGKAVYDVANELVNKPGPLSEDKWADIVRLIGKEGVIAVVQYVAFYSYVCMILNGFDCKVPEDEELAAKY
jgi:hypothetical protein